MGIGLAGIGFRNRLEQRRLAQFEQREGEPAQVLAAIEAAGRSERAVTAPLLARILKGTRQPEEQRLAAAEALERLGGKLAGPTLLEAAEAEDDGPVREAAREALNGLTLLGAEGEGDANDE